MGPIVAQGIVVFGLGPPRLRLWIGGQSDGTFLICRRVPRANPMVRPGSARVQIDGIIHEFRAKTGKWKHVDTRAILDTAQDKALKALQKPDSRR